MLSVVPGWSPVAGFLDDFFTPELREEGGVSGAEALGRRRLVITVTLPANPANEQKLE